MSAARPLLRYHGGKWMLAPWILGFFPPHSTYVEPYAGGASVLLLKQRSKAEIYNDLAGDVVDVFRVLQNPEQAAELRRRAHLTPFAREEFDIAYQRSDDPIERARRCIARSFMGFGSASVHRKHQTGFRAGARRSNTAPAMDWTNWPDQVPAYVERLRGVTIECRDAFACIAQHNYPDTLFYVDPPYVHSTRTSASGVRQKYEVELTDADHADLAEVLHGLQGMVVLSGYPSELYDRELYPAWERHERIALADGARRRTEVVWLNPACSAALEQSRGGLFAAEAAA